MKGITLNTYEYGVEIQEKKLVLLILNNKKIRLIDYTTKEPRVFTQTTWLTKRYMAEFIDSISNSGLNITSLTLY